MGDRQWPRGGYTSKFGITGNRDSLVKTIHAFTHYQFLHYNQWGLEPATELF